jgi:hypothetical protein
VRLIQGGEVRVDSCSIAMPGTKSSGARADLLHEKPPLEWLECLPEIPIPSAR